MWSELYTSGRWLDEMVSECIKYKKINRKPNEILREKTAEKARRSLWFLLFRIVIVQK